MRYLGVDFGTRRVGIAVGDDESRLAMPLKIIEVQNQGEAVTGVLAEVTAQGAEIVVLGLARDLSGRLGPKAKECEVFAEQLRAEGLAVELWDERLTTQEAERSLREGGASRRVRRKNLDAVAAQRILQSYLDAQANQQRG